MDRCDILIKFQKVDAEAKIPIFAKTGDAGMDVYSNAEMTIMPGEITAIPTGVKMELPEGYAALVWDKSGIALKNGIKTMGGVLDAGFRGEVKIIMTNLSKDSFFIPKHTKVAQILIQKVECPKIEITEVLSESERGESAFGSTGLA